MSETFCGKEDAEEKDFGVSRDSRMAAQRLEREIMWIQ